MGSMDLPLADRPLTGSVRIMAPLRLRSFSAFALLLGISVQAQLPIVDISAVTTINDQVEIRLRPDAAFDGYFSSLVFTVRWTNADGANLGNIQQDVSVVQYISITKSGAEQVSGPYRYQVFTGFGTGVMSSVGESWAPMEEVVVCRLNIINGSSVFVLSDDPHTVSMNGEFYVSLNGQDRTGEIYTFTTTLAESDPGLSGPSVLPNPTNGLLTVDWSEAGDGPVRMELFDATGRLVWNKVVSPDQGSMRSRIDMSSMANGLFFLKLSNSTGSTTQRIVLGR